MRWWLIYGSYPASKWLNMPVTVPSSWLISNQKNRTFKSDPLFFIARMLDVLHESTDQIMFFVFPLGSLPLVAWFPYFPVLFSLSLVASKLAFDFNFKSRFLIATHIAINRLFLFLQCTRWRWQWYFCITLCAVLV